MTSIGAKLLKLQGLKPGDLTTWEANFLQSVRHNVERNKGTGGLSERQVDVIEKIYAKHFGG